MKKKMIAVVLAALMIAGTGAAVWIDDFERSNPLDDYTGDKSAFDVVSSPTYDGSGALKTTSDLNDATVLNQTDTYGPGSTIKTKIYYDESGANQNTGIGTVFAASDTDNYYLVGAINRGSSEQDSLVIYKKVNGGFTKLNGVSVSPGTLVDDTWYEVRIGWETDGTANNGDINAGVYDSTGQNQLIFNSVTDTTYTSAGYLGFRSNVDNAVWDAQDFNSAPTASFTSDSPVLTGEDFGLNASGSSDPDGDALSYYWDLDNDGNYDDATGVTPTHSKPDDGTYTIGLEVSDGDKNDTTSNTVTVENRDPVADFTFSSSGTTISVDGTSSSDQDGSISSYEWDWTSDGTYEDTGSTASHDYGSQGSYDVTLRVTDNDGATDTQTQTALVGITFQNIEPADGTTVSTYDPTFNASFESEDTLDTAVLEVDGTQEASISLSGTQDSVSHQVTGLSAGSHTYTWDVNDSTKSRTETYSFTVEDTTDPSVDTVEPIGDITYRDPILNASFSDNFELSSYTLDVDGTQEDTGSLSGTTGSASYTLGTVDYGTYTQTWTVEDTNGNTHTRSEDFTVQDTKPPEINSADATDNANNNLIVTGGDSVTLTANVTEEGGATVQNVSAGIFGENYTLTDGNGDDIYDATVTVPAGLTDGFKDLTIEAEDDSGNRQSSSFSNVIEVDTTPPSISNIWTPDNAAQLEEFNVTAEITEDRTSVLNPTVSVFGTSYSLSPANGDNYTAAVTVDYDQATGDYTGTVTAEDVEGNTQSNTTDTITVTETLPEINITSPVAGESIYGDSVYVEYIIEDYPDQYIANTNATVNGTTKTGNSTFSVIDEGTYYVKVQAETTDGRTVSKNHTFQVGTEWTELDTDQSKNAFIESGQRVIHYDSDLNRDWITKLNAEVGEVEATSNYLAAWLPSSEQLVKLRKDNGSVVQYYDRSDSERDLYTMRSDGDRLFIAGRSAWNAYQEDEDWSVLADEGQLWSLTGTFTEDLDAGGYPIFSMEIITNERVWIAGKNQNQAGDIWLARMTNEDGDTAWSVDMFDSTNSNAGTPRYLENFVEDTSMLISTDQGNMLNYDAGTISSIPQPSAPKRMKSLVGHIFVEDGGVVDTYNYTGDYSNMPVENTFSFTGETVTDFQRNNEKLTFIVKENEIYREQSLNLSEIDISIDSFTSNKDDYKRTETGTLTVKLDGGGLVDKVEIDGQTVNEINANHYEETFTAGDGGTFSRTAKIYGNGKLLDKSTLTYDVKTLPEATLHEPEEEAGFPSIPRIVEHKFEIDEGSVFDVEWKLVLNGNVIESGQADYGPTNYTVDHEFDEDADQRNKWRVVTEWANGSVDTENRGSARYYTTGKPSIIAGGYVSDVIQMIGNALGLGFFGAAILLNLLISVLIAVGIMTATSSLGYASLGFVGTFLTLGLFGFLPSWVAIAIGIAVTLTATYYIYKGFAGGGD